MRVIISQKFLYALHVSFGHWEFQCTLRECCDSSQDSLSLALTQRKANVFDPQHLRGTSSELVQSMFNIGRKAAELKRTKLQSKIQKQQSELQKKCLENRLQMASKGTGQGDGKGSAGKNPKCAKLETEEEEEIKT